MAIRSFGTRIWVGGELLGGWRDLSPTAREASIIDVTCQDSADNSREFIGGMIDNGTIEIEGLYDFDDAGQAVLRDGINTEIGVTVAFSDGSGYTFTGTVKSFGEGAPLDDAVPFTSSVQISGDVYPIAPVLYVTGTLTADGSDTAVFEDLIGVGYRNGKFAWSKDAVAIPSSTSFVSSTGVVWLLITSDPEIAQWTSTADVATPDLVSTLYPGAWNADTNPHGWKPVSPATGTPVVSTEMPN